MVTLIDDQPPPSAVPVSDGILGLAGLFAAWSIAAALTLGPLLSAWLVLFGTALPMLWAERRRLLLRPSLSGPNAPTAWILGTCILIVPAYLLHVQDGTPYSWLAAIAVVAPAYLLRALVLERRSWFSGAASQLLLWMTGGGQRPERTTLHIWGLKAFFIPIYAVSLTAVVSLSRALPLDTAASWLLFAVTVCYIIDLAFGLASYVFASNNLVPNIRDTSPLLLGWIVCLLCYPPFLHHWPAAAEIAQFEVRWPELAAASTDAIVLAGAAVMLCSMAIYIPATIVFGLRFSNLTNRGVITSGPYRWIKHPAYTAHIVNAWVIVMIFLPASGTVLTWELMLVPVAYSILYTLRMKTEEAHMRSDPAYRSYEAWIARHGLLARSGRLFAATVTRSRPLHGVNP